MYDRQETQLYKLLMPVLADLLAKYYRQAVDHYIEDEQGVEVFHVRASGAVERPLQDGGMSSFEQDADAFIMDAIVSMFTGSFQTEERSRKIWFILDFCYSIAKRAIYQVLRGKVDDFTDRQLVWLVQAQVETRLGIRGNVPKQWCEFKNRLVVENLDEE